MRGTCTRSLVTLAMLIAASSLARAQGNYEIQVYGAPTVAPRSLMLELHSNFTFQGEKHPADGTAPTYHAEHETIEITAGLTSWSEVGFYFFTSEQPDLGAQYVGSHIRPRVRVPDSWKWPVGVSLSTEIGYQRPKFSADTWTWELRPIIDKQMGRWYWAVNPAFERTWKGPGTRDGMVFAPNVKVGFDFSEKVSGGVEYYGSVGDVTNFDPSREQVHQFFGAVDLNVSPDWEINFGVGVGTTPATDHLMAKLILGRHFAWGTQPAR